jgi:hypothetical protein
VLVHGPDSEGDSRALGALLSDLSEVFKHVGNGIVVAADDRAEQIAEVGVAFDAQGSLSEGRGDFRAGSAVVNQRIYPGTS